MDEIVIVGWRRLAVRRWGVPAGKPVFLMHGTPGSRLGVSPAEAEAVRRLGVTLITFDRPGYGRSDPLRARTVADAADDVRAIADSFGYRRFAVLGRSGGGPHALACAERLGDRITRVAVLGTLAPFEAEGLDWGAGMVAANREQYDAARHGHATLARVLYPRVVAMRADPEHLLRDIETQSPSADHAVLVDPEYRRWAALSFAEAVGRSLDGWACDNLALTRPWGFDPGRINVPTLLWHGVRDVFSPVAHARWLATRIRDALLHLAEDKAHLSASAAQADAIRWLLYGGNFQPTCGIAPLTAAPC